MFFSKFAKRQWVWMVAGVAFSSAAQGSSFVARTTGYSLGAKVGGPDELQDKWTNRGYTSTGRNLTPGVVAINQGSHRLGSIFRDTETGNCYIAADVHGNDNARVIDVYMPPSQYGSQPGSMRFEKLRSGGSVGKTPEAIREQLSSIPGCKVPEGESAKDWLAGKRGPASTSAHYRVRESEVTEGSSKDRCSRSSTLDRDAGCDRTDEAISKARVVEHAVEQFGSAGVRLEGESLTRNLVAQDQNSVNMPFERGLKMSLDGAEILHQARQANAIQGMVQMMEANRHHRKQVELKSKLERDRKEIQSAQANDSDLTSSGNGDGSSYELQQDSVQKFKMNQAGAVVQQLCNAATDPGCAQARSNRRKGFEDKKQHVSSLVEQLGGHIQKEQAEAEERARLGAVQSFTKAKQQAQAAQEAEATAAQIQAQLEQMKQLNEGQIGAPSLPTVNGVQARGPASALPQNLVEVRRALLPDSSAAPTSRSFSRR